MAQAETTLPEHFGRWLYWELMGRYGGNRKQIVAATGRVWKTLESYCADASPTNLLRTGSQFKIAAALGLSVEQLETAYIGKPTRAIPKDPRGRKAASDMLTTDEVASLKRLLPTLLDMEPELRRWLAATTQRPLPFPEEEDTVLPPGESESAPSPEAKRPLAQNHQAKDE